MAEQQGPWEIDYYETENGRVPVLEWIQNLPGEAEKLDEGEKPKTDQGLTLWYIDQLALLGTEARYPLIRHLEGKLWELRWKASGRQHRIVYFAASGRKFVLVHGFIKKAQTTPKKELEKARNRMRDYERRHKA